MLNLDNTSGQRSFLQHEGKVVEKGAGFSHVFALTLNPTNQSEGIVRVITSRQGDITVSGYIDKSQLYKIKSKNGFEKFEIVETLKIEGSERLVEKLIDPEHEFLGFEGPDLVYDKQEAKLHLYFTIPLIAKEGKNHKVFLGHAVGTSLDNLTITKPVVDKDAGANAKELSFVPADSKGIRHNLVESTDRIEGVSYSTVRVVRARSYDPPWELGEVIFHPKHDGYPWCAGHASPGPFMPRNFIDVGDISYLDF